MKKILIFTLVAIFIIGVIPAFAAKGRRGASDKALQNASEEAVFHRVGDWFATIGKSDEEKKAIIAERKAKRTAAKMAKEAEKKKKMAEKELKRKKKEAEKKLKNK